MKRNRFTEERIIPILKESEDRDRTLIGTTGSPSRRFTGGDPDTAGSKVPKPRR